MTIDAYELWMKLVGLYGCKTTQNKALLIRKLMNIKYKEGCFVIEHLSSFQGVIN